jgi:3-hydroxyisobutyrate dehydrogenase-like beta-hydroxyacid dehydrogenase
MRVALLGLGEAGASIAEGLKAAGVDVRGWDPVRPVDGIASAVDAVVDAEVVLSVNAAAVASAESVADVLTAGQLYADLNTTSPAVKRLVAAIVSPAVFVDVALLGPVRGLATPCLAAGPGADRFAALHWLPVESIGGEPGDAARRKLLRSVFMKGIAAAVLESLAAAEAAGDEAWLRGDIESVLGPELTERLVSGSELHAKRRVEEMKAATALLEELGIEPHVASAAAAVLESLTSQ